MTDGIQDGFCKFNITAAAIPGASTCKIQSLNVCINKPFKEHFHHLWMHYMQESISNIQNGEHDKLPSKQLVVNRVTETNKLLDSHTSMVQKSFLVSGISNSLDGSQNNMIRCAEELSEISIPYGKIPAQLTGTSESDSNLFNSSADDDNESGESESEGNSDDLYEESTEENSDNVSEESSADE